MKNGFGRPSLLLLAMVFAGCSTMPARPLMPVPASLEAVTPVQVQRHGFGIGKKPMSFGEWHIVDYRNDKRPRESSHSFGDPLFYSRTKFFAAYSFVLSPEGRDEWGCYCEARRAHQDVGMRTKRSETSVSLTYEEVLDCELLRLRDGETWTLHIIGSDRIDGEGYSGTLANGTRRFALEPSHNIGKMTFPGPPTGYLFEREGVQLASAEFIEPGFVRIGDAAGEDRDLLAAAAAALLMNPGPI